MYSLVSAPVVAFELIRSGSGSAVAADLSVALRLDSSHLPALSGMYCDDTVRRKAWDEIRSGSVVLERLQTVLAAVKSAAEAHPATPFDANEAYSRLSAAPMGGPDDLVRLISEDIFDWTWRPLGDVRVQTEASAVSVVADAVVASAEQERLTPRSYARLRTPWRLAEHDLPAGDDEQDFGPQNDAVQRLLRTLRGATAAQMCALDAVVDQRRRLTVGAWSNALHDVAWAAHLTDRVRTAALAQLQVVRYWPVPDVVARRRLHTAIPGVTGAVAALVVADLVDDATTTELLAAWESTFGRLG